MERSRQGRRRTSADTVGDIAARLVRAPLPALPAAIAAALGALGARAGADRVALWALRHCARQFALVHAWSRPGCGSPARIVTTDELPWLVREVSEGRRVAFRSLAELPPDAEAERRLFARHGPRSAVALPIGVGESTVALLVVGTLRRERSWGAATLALLEHAAVALAAAIVRARARDAALETEGRLAGVLDAEPDGVLLVRRDGRIELANDGASAIFLRTRGELRGERLRDVLAVPPGAARPARRATVDALLAGPAPVELLARRGDGETAPVAVTVREVHTPGAELRCCIVRDLSASRRAAEEGARLRNELAFMGRTALVAELGAGFAHELNQPLTAILSNAETALRLLRSSRAGDRAELAETLRDVVSDTRRAADVLGRMREMLRRRDVQRVPVDVAALLVSVARRFRELAVARSVCLSVESGSGLAPVPGDPVQLEQVVTNLVLNAFEAMAADPAGPRTIALRARPAEPGGVDLSVRDSGPGLSDEVLSHAFDPFFTTKPGGLGMGLGISRSIVEAHGGRLLARNNADRGATFELHLPGAPPAAVRASERADDRRRPA